ncbi:MAG: MgtC/SapB family protein [Candidatus Nealsonbacteria bacterium]|nr:MgtC/SapB family protein [Candidatus Nealsonbacteria bacterium]
MEIFLQLILATLLGGLIGLEREYNRKEAGLRTYSLVSLGATFFTIIAYNSLGLFFKEPPIGFDPSRIIGQIVLGIGFIGAGLIVYREFHVEGLTTAAGLWVAAAIGAAVGVKLYTASIFVTILVLAVLVGLRPIEERFIKGKKKAVK